MGSFTQTFCVLTNFLSPASDSHLCPQLWVCLLLVVLSDFAHVFEAQLLDL